MIKQFFKDSAIYSFSTIISRGISIFMVPIYTRVFSPADYGVIDMIAVVSSLINLTIALEISQAVARFFPENKSLEEKRSYASTALWFTVCVNIAFLILAQYYCSYLGPLVLGTSYNEYLFRIAIFSIVTSGILQLVHNQLRWQLQSLNYSIVSIMMLLVTVTTTIVLIFGFKLGLISVFYGQLIGNVVGLFLSYKFAGDSFGLVFDKTKLKTMLEFSLPLVPSSAAVFIAVFIDRIAIKELMTLADVGLYGIGYRIASMAALVMVGVQTSMTPLIYNHYQESNTPYEIARIFRFFLWAALMCFMGLSMFASEAIMIFTTPSFYGAYVIVPILVAAIIVSGMSVFAPGLAIAKRTKITAAVSITTALLNTGLNFALIPYLGIRGSALATLMGAVMQFTLYMWLGNKYYPIPYQWKRYLKVLTISILFVLIGTAIKVTFWADIIIKIFISIIGLILITWILIDKNEFEKVNQFWLKMQKTICAK